MSMSPIQEPSSELLAARDGLHREHFRKEDRRSFNPDSITTSAREDPVGRILLTIPDGRLGVEGYRELIRIFPDGVVRGSTIPDLSTFRRDSELGTQETRLEMIVTGGQTGVDQAALQVALKLGKEVCGIVPRGRATERGRLDERYPMIENHSSNVDDRTQHNFVGADGTLALFKGAEVDGTALTIIGPLRAGRPLFVAHLDEPVSDALVAMFREWLVVNNIRCLNVGGPRQSYYEARGASGDIQREAESFLGALLAGVEAGPPGADNALIGASFPERKSEISHVTPGP